MEDITGCSLSFLVYRLKKAVNKTEPIGFPWQKPHVITPEEKDLIIKRAQMIIDKTKSL